MTYSEFTQWSILHDCVIARLSMADDRGREFFCILPNYGQKGYREMRDEALDAIAYAIESGLQPGEVRWQPTSQMQQRAGLF